MTCRIRVGDSCQAFHVKRDHNREHPETPKETDGVRGSKWIERARAGLGGPVARQKPRGRGSRAWAFRWRRASCGLAEGVARGRLDFGQVRPSMSERACQKPFLSYLKVKSYVDI